MRGILLQNFLGKRPATKKKPNLSVSVEENVNIVGIQRKRKRKDLNIIDQEISGGTRQDRKDSDAVIEVVASMDCISQLPDHIIHRILSNLRTEDVARSSVLSKKWKHARDTFPILDFDQRYFHLQEGEKHGSFEERIRETQMKNKKFQNFVDHSLQIGREEKFSIEKFRLYMTSCGADWVPHMDRWIAVAIESNVKELEIHVQVKKYRRYSLPQTVLTAKRLTMLSLYGCKLESCNDVQLPLLKNLCLKNLNVNELKIQSLILSCPLIEDLRLISCSELKILKVSTLLNLKRVEVHFCHGLKSIDIEVPNLQIFWYYGKKSMQCEINLSTCESLKRLTLEDANMTDELFQDRISKFPILEQLILSKCNSLERIKITNHRLRSLALRGCKNLVDADIDTPNLLSFEYDGDDTMPFISMDPSGLHEAKLSFDSKHKANLDSRNLAKLDGFLAKFNHSKGMKLVIRSKKNVIIDEEWNYIFFPQLNELKLEVVKPSTSYEDLVERLLRTHHPKNLGLVSSSSGEVLQLIYQKIMKREKEPSCCKYYSNKCWRHYLEDATLGHAHTAVAEDEMTIQWLIWLKLLALAASDPAHFRLKWKYDKADLIT